MKHVFLAIAGFAFVMLSGCQNNQSSETSVSGDPAIIAEGENIFNRNCSGCHNFKQDGIGPALGGITKKVSATWLRTFIRDPKSLIDSRDVHANEVFHQYKVMMPSFPLLKADELDDVVAFLNFHASPAQKRPSTFGKEIANPVPAAIPLSKLVAELKLVAQMPASSDSGKTPLARITQLGYWPNSTRLFVLDLRGKLYTLTDRKPSVYMDMAKLKPAFISEPGLATGFGSFAFHPDFAKNGLLYTSHTEGPKSGKADFGYADSIKVTLQWVLTEWKTGDPKSIVFSGSGRELLRINMVSGIHGVQEIAFNPLSKNGDQDYGNLYIGVGDGGAVENGFPALAHSRQHVWGTILRINPAGRNSANGRYGIPPQNPFAGIARHEGIGEVYAYGFRNPHRMTWDKSGRMLVSNVGQSNIESINLIVPGGDYGWPLREGNFAIDTAGDLSKVYPLPVNDTAFHFTYPVAEFDHDEGKAITGGFEYQGKAVPSLKGKFVFGDIPTGRLFFINETDIKQGTAAPIQEWKITLEHHSATLKEVTKSQRVDLHFGRDALGELYVLTKADGKIYKIESAGVKH